MPSRTESAPPTNSLILPARPSAFATFHAEGASPMFHSLIARFPMVDTEHFKNIRDNKFKVENIMKLSTEYESVRPKTNIKESGRPRWNIGKRTPWPRTHEEAHIFFARFSYTVKSSFTSLTRAHKWNYKRQCTSTSINC